MASVRFAVGAILCLATLACTDQRLPDSSEPEAEPVSGRVSPDPGLQKVQPAPTLAEPPRGPFGLSLVASEDGEPLSLEGFVTSDECGDCHERQMKELAGSMHSVSHTDSLYRQTALLARKEAGEEVYLVCSGCHSPQGVVSGALRGHHGEELPEIVEAGIVCDVCHQVSSLTGADGPWGEPGNASFVLSPDDDRKFGPPSGNDDDADHAVETRDFLGRAEFCASCHTVVHPFNGVRLETTYAEWRGSVYDEHGIQCQDCHMRTVEEAIEVARTLKPIEVIGSSVPDGPQRPIWRHYFVGGNVNAARLGGGAAHGKMAEARLKSAARVELAVPEAAPAGQPLRFDVLVHNIGAGHALPTSLVELREIWVDLVVRTGAGEILLHSGALEADGSIQEGTMRFGAHGVDAKGQLTYKPWEVAAFSWKRLIPPKGTARDTFQVVLPPGAAGPIAIEARLLYRSAPPAAVAAIMGEDAFEPAIVEMATARGTVPVR